MSRIYASLALLATFGAVALVTVAVQDWIVRRRHTLRLLQDEVGNVSTNLREQELSESFLDRVVVPVAAGIGRVARRLTPEDVRARIGQKLVMAGNPPGWDADKVAAFKVFGLVGGAVLGLFMIRLVHASGTLTILLVALGAFAGFTAPGAVLSGRVASRQEDMRKALADT